MVYIDLDVNPLRNALRRVLVLGRPSYKFSVSEVGIYKLTLSHPILYNAHYSMGRPLL